MIENFRNMNVYKKAFMLSVEIHQTSLKFPKIEQYALADQIRRSSKSVCANLAEGFGKQKASKSEFKRFVSMALGSAHEILVWIDYSIEFQYIDAQTGNRWISETQAVIKMLHGLHSKIQT